MTAERTEDYMAAKRREREERDARHAEFEAEVRAEYERIRDADKAAGVKARTAAQKREAHDTVMMRRAEAGR